MSMLHKCDVCGKIEEADGGHNLIPFANNLDETCCNECHGVVAKIAGEVKEEMADEIKKRIEAALASRAA